jgi:hypothetical protein
MVTFKFELIDSQVPEVRGRNVITDSNVGGTKNTYRISKYYGKTPWWIKLLGLTKRYEDDNYVGIKTFLRPYQSVWDKKSHRLPPVYWGKGPMLNMWLVLSNDYKNIKDIKALLPEADTTKHCTKIFGRDFLSHELAKNLKLNQSFYQSNFEKL